MSSRGIEGSRRELQTDAEGRDSSCTRNDTLFSLPLLPCRSTEMKPRSSPHVESARCTSNCTSSEVRWQRGDAGGGHAVLPQQPTRNLPVCWRPIRPRPAGNEADRVALVIDALGLGIDPTVANRSLQQLIEGHSLFPRSLLEDGDDQLPLRCPVVP